MFASEKVMLEYFDQLLNEDEESAGSDTGKPLAQSQVIQNKTDANVQQSNSIVNESSLDEFASTDSVSHSTVHSRESTSLQVPQSTRPFKEPEYSENNTANSSLEKLLQQVNLSQREKIAKERQKTVDLVRSVTQVPDLETQTDVKRVVETQVKQDVTPQKILSPSTINKPVETVETVLEQKLETDVEKKVEVVDSFPEEPFQALFFSVAGLSLAVPLHELGGIHQLDVSELSSLFGKPDWFKGVMLSREKKLNVVDSAKWVMPEKYNAAMAASLNYKYLIMLGDSNWGLAAEKLVETESISPDAVKWRKNAHKRPWLMGTIKEKMCALLHVSDLIAMLEQGIDTRQV